MLESHCGIIGKPNIHTCTHRFSHTAAHTHTRVHTAICQYWVFMGLQDSHQSVAILQRLLRMPTFLILQTSPSLKNFQGISWVIVKEFQLEGPGCQYLQREADGDVIADGTFSRQTVGMSEHLGQVQVGVQK